MKRACLSLIGVIGLLFSCAPTAKEHMVQIAQQQNKLPTFSESIGKEYASFLSEHASIGVSAEQNTIYSPLSHFVSGQLEGYRTGENDLNALGQIVKETNVVQRNLSLKNSPALASTNPLEEADIKALNNVGVSTFEGTLEELRNSLKSHYGFETEMPNPGEYYLSYVEVSSRLYNPRELIDKAPFHGVKGTKETTFAGGKATTGYKETDAALIVDIPFVDLLFRVVMPKDGHALEEATPEMLWEELPQKRIAHHLPEFEFSSDLELEKRPDRYVVQTSAIGVDRYGIKATAYTVNGPGAAAPDFEAECWIDRPFLFAISVNKIPLFVGTYVG